MIRDVVVWVTLGLAPLVALAPLSAGAQAPKKRVVDSYYAKRQQAQAAQASGDLIDPEIGDEESEIGLAGLSSGPAAPTEDSMFEGGAAGTQNFRAGPRTTYPGQ